MLRKYLDDGELESLYSIGQQLLSLNGGDIRRGLVTAKKIRGLGTAGASGLLSLMYPDRFATVDQFVVKAGVRGAVERKTGLSVSARRAKLKVAASVALHAPSSTASAANCGNTTVRAKRTNWARSVWY